MGYCYDNLKLEKGMYGEAGRSFSQVLEGADPSEHYKGTALEGLDAYQRQLKRFDIKVKGAGSDVVEKFFRTAESAVLFPEYIARAVRHGMEEGNLLPSTDGFEELCKIIEDILPCHLEIRYVFWYVTWAWFWWRYSWTPWRGRGSMPALRSWFSLSAMRDCRYWKIWG